MLVHKWRLSKTRVYGPSFLSYNLFMKNLGQIYLSYSTANLTQERKCKQEFKDIIIKKVNDLKKFIKLNLSSKYFCIASKLFGMITIQTEINTNASKMWITFSRFFPYLDNLLCKTRMNVTNGNNIKISFLSRKFFSFTL